MSDFKVFINYSYNLTIFKAYKKILYNFFSIYKKWQVNIAKKKKDSEEKHAEDIKIFLKKKRIKRRKKVSERYENLTEKEKEKKHNKNLSEEQKRN